MQASVQSRWVQSASVQAAICQPCMSSDRSKQGAQGASRAATLCCAQVMFVLFLVVAAMWAVVLLRQRAHAHRLHCLMAALVVCKALTLLSQAGMYQLIRSTGHPEGWNVAFYVFNLLRGVLFFTVSPALTQSSLRGALALQLTGKMASVCVTPTTEVV